MGNGDHEAVPNVPFPVNFPSSKSENWIDVDFVVILLSSSLFVGKKERINTLYFNWKRETIARCYAWASSTGHSLFVFGFTTKKSGF